MPFARRTVIAPSVALLLAAGASIVPAAPASAATWSVVPTPNATAFNNGFLGVDATAGGDVWAVGHAFYDQHPAIRPLAARFSGGTWTVTPTPPLVDYGGFSSVDGTASGNVWAVGQQEINGVPHPLSERWNGSSWSIAASPLPPGTSSGSLGAVKTFSATDAWAVGSTIGAAGQHTFIQRWNGTAWSQVPSPSPHPSTNGLRGVDGVSPADVWAIGGVGAGDQAAGLVLRWNGSAWSQVALPAPPAGLSRVRLEDVVAVSATDVWIVGYAQSGCCQQVPYYLHWTGQGWQQGRANVPGIFTAVTALSPTRVYAVGGGVISRWNGSAWSVEAQTVQGTLDEISAAGPSTVWTVGRDAGTPSRTLALRTTNG
jgi:hypothetical protein